MEMSNRKTVSMFFKKLGALIGAGVPLADALDSFAQDPLVEPYTEIPALLSEGLREGQNLSALLAKHDTLFNPLTIEMIAAGERQGNLDVLLPQIADRVSEGLLEPNENKGKSTALSFEPSGLAWLVKLCLLGAEKGASDIHFDSTLDGGAIRFRVDGLLTHHQELSKDELQQLLAAAKYMFKCDPAEHRLPQDGRARLTPEGGPLTMRLCVVPLMTGESATIRLLPRWTLADIPSLDVIFQSDEVLQSVKRIAHHPHGMVVVSGPTGSGKTTTLYSLLAETSAPEKKVFSIEDPVELCLPGIQQLPVNISIGLTFRKGLSAALRSDPDVICAGEIRDFETAEILLQSALAGHKVFTSIHGKDAIGSLLRLLEVGLKAPVLADGLQAIIGQRLVRKLCLHCRKAMSELSEHADLEMAQELLESECELKAEELYLPMGCDKCSGGFKGRVAVHEFLPMTGKLAKQLTKEACYEALMEAAKEDGFKTYWQDGLRLLSSGLTSPGEIVRSLSSYLMPPQ